MIGEGSGTARHVSLCEEIEKQMCLFPAANHRLTDSDQQQLLAAFERLESAEAGHANREKYLAIADQLARSL